jgi:6-phosphofructokinase 1
LLATRLAAGATAALERGEFGVLLGLRGSEVKATPLEEVASRRKELDPALLALAKVLAA